MDVIDKKIMRERKKRYKALVKLRKARDIASKHLEVTVPCLYFYRNIKNHDKVDWLNDNSVNSLSVIFYEFAQKHLEDR